MILKDNKSKKYTPKIIQNKIICGETLSVLKKIPSNSIQTIITSPSYFLQKEYENKNENFQDYLDNHKEIIKVFLSYIFVMPSP